MQQWLESIKKYENQRFAEITVQLQVLCKIKRDFAPK
jgi:hypothetical protein